MSSAEMPDTRDYASSIYSRSSGSPKPIPPSHLATAGLSSLPMQHDVPEINTLDHEIALARGSTIALETTRTRLQRSKTDRRLSLRESREEKLQQWEHQEHENQFYHMCLAIFQELSRVAIDLSQDLALQHCFEPEVSPAGNARVQQAAHKLQRALEQSQEREAQAAHRWKRRWYVPRFGGPSTRWI